MKENKKFCYLKIILTIGSFVAIILFKSSIDWRNIYNNTFDFRLLKEIAYDLSIGIFSAMILVWLIDDISNRIQVNVEKAMERGMIKRYDRILQSYIERYCKMFYYVSTPHPGCSNQEESMPTSFTLSDMRNLYESLFPLAIDEAFGTTRIESFLESELNLRNQFESFVKVCDFAYYTEFASIFSEFVRVSLEFDHRKMILDIKRLNSDVIKNMTKNSDSKMSVSSPQKECNVSVRLKNVKLKVKPKGESTPSEKLDIHKNLIFDMVHDDLKSNADSKYEAIKKGESVTFSIATPIIPLYIMMQKERDIIFKYQKEIQKIV